VSVPAVLMLFIWYCHRLTLCSFPSRLTGHTFPTILLYLLESGCFLRWEMCWHVPSRKVSPTPALQLCLERLVLLQQTVTCLVPRQM
jgi:hypothetical protein